MLDTKDVLTPRGKPVSLSYRLDTTDLATIGSTFSLWGNLVDEYGLASVYTSGKMLDIGAHIGAVSLAFLLDNPEATATAVEPLPENVELMRLNAEACGVMDRLTIIEGAIGVQWVRYGPDVHRYIADITGSGGPAVRVKHVRMASLLKEPIALLKIDCEGCEWNAFKADLSKIRLIVGEYHYQGPGPLLAFLERTHEVICDDGPTGSFRAVLR